MQKMPRNLVITRKYLKEHGLVAVPFDKGVGICVMEITTYNNKLMNVLNLSQFEKIQYTRKNAKDVILKEEERINLRLKQLMDEKKISEDLCKELKSMGGQPPRLYGLAKVHKDVIPLRPVLSMPGSPYFNIAGKVTQWLQVIPESKIDCSTEKVVKDLKDVVVDDDETLISFDVSSLYTNVPVKEAIVIAADKLYSGEHETPPMDKDTFVILLELATIM